MKRESRLGCRWYPYMGIVAMGALAFGLSLRLEGAPVPGRGGSNADSSVAVTAREISDAKQISKIQRDADASARGLERITAGNLGSFPHDGDIPVMPVIVVDYRDDEGTRLREAGLLNGPLPLPTHLQGGIAAGGCSFAVECDDGNPCTADACNFTAGQPAGSGTCVNTVVGNGADGQNGNAQCPSHFGSLCGGCNDGLFCNGVETCLGGVCVAGTPPCSGIQVCSESLDVCQPQACANNAECVNLNATTQKFCNGSETCVGGVCQAGTNPCGSNATCGEKRCSSPAVGTILCVQDTDCAVFPGSTCSVNGPACLQGRCCQPGVNGEPVCSKRTKASCDSGGGIFYGHDAGFLEGSGGTVCPLLNGVTVRCPKYSAGIAPFGAFPQLLGPISDSAQPRAPFGTALNKLGDDYKMTNAGLTANDFMLLDYLRFIGGMVVTERISFEIYDKDGNFIEDLFFIGQAAFGLYPVQFSPPLTIPAEGFIVARVASAFAPNARIVWATTDVTDAGTNDPAKLWVNNGPAGNFGTSGRLAFELEGDKTSPPSGACCKTVSGTISKCENAKLPWVCKGEGGSYLGDGTFCAQCDDGPNVGEYCRRCSDNTAQVCNRDSDCTAGTCDPFTPACGSPGVCVAEPACTVGACCNPTTGECLEISETSCTSGGGNFQGFGTDCDADNGKDDGKQHCCPQPLASYTGADNCEDVQVHVITVPPPGEVKVITITGDNTTASSTQANPDSCFQPSTDPNADPGWWEGFTITDNCARVRIDHCCTDPVHRPAYRVIYNGCPCGAARFSLVDPYKAPEPDVARGVPYCAEDDNLWSTYGLLTPGTYYYPVYSALAGHHGEYQLHLSVESCPLAACCVGDQCTDGVNQLECDALGGFFQAPPQKASTTTACSGSTTCGTGSCCTGPGACFDISGLNTLVTPADCPAQTGNYVGGVRCRGGLCSGGSPAASCATDADCGLNAPCLGGTQEKAQPSPCPICEIQGTGNCQLFDNTTNFTLSDRNLGDDGILAADDFVPSGTTLSTMCVWGFYIDGDPDAVIADCGPNVSQDFFRVRVYSNDPSNGRMPGTLVGESLATSERGALDSSRIETVLGVEMYGYQLTLLTPISTLTAGTTYWLEVSNDPTQSGPATCLWFWQQRDQTSSSYSFGGTDLGYAPGFESPFDMVFCTNFGLSASGIGGLTAACCKCDSTCSAKTLVDCDNDNGIWNIALPNCTGAVCPSGAPANDACANAQSVGEGQFLYSNQCATTDGYGPIQSDFGESQIDFDLWYTYVAPSNCPLVISMCPTGQRYDSMFAVYHTPGDPTTCPACPLTQPVSTATLAGIAQDESCTGAAVGGPGIWEANEQLNRNALAGECFLIRVGSFPGSRGTGTVIISGCEGGAAPLTPLADPSGINKSRFISFSVPSAATAAAGESALRVKFVSLHVVVPPYTGGASIPFTLFNGQSQFVGPPVQYVESASSQTPFYASKLQCTPHYQDWTTVGLLHVTGYAIVPSSEYQVENLAASCMGNEGSCTSVSAGLTVKTTRWGDVAAPFNPPDNSVQPAFSDIGSLVDKFKSVIGAPIKARAMLVGVDARGDINITPDVGFTHIAGCVDGFKGLPYPHKPGKCAGAGGSCIANGDCTGANTPPCTLCP